MQWPWIQKLCISFEVQVGCIGVDIGLIAAGLWRSTSSMAYMEVQVSAGCKCRCTWVNAGSHA